MGEAQAQFCTCSILGHRCSAKRLTVILRNNKAFGVWGGVFAANVVMAAAALDRLHHRCTVVNIRGESYRLKEKRAAGQRRYSTEAASIIAGA